jgi:hypothetical protein
MTNEQAEALGRLINALESIMDTAKSLPCPEGSVIIADAVRVLAYNRMLDAPMEVVREMLKENVSVNAGL